MKAFFVQIRDWISGVLYFASRARRIADAALNQKSTPMAVAPAVETKIQEELIKALRQLRSDNNNVADVVMNIETRLKSTPAAVKTEIPEELIKALKQLRSDNKNVADTVMNIETRLKANVPTTPAAVETEIPAELLESLCQLRSDTVNSNNRTGRAVTVFIPAETLERLRPDAAKQNLFVNKVAAQLVRRSLYAVWHPQAGTVEFPVKKA